MLSVEMRKQKGMLCSMAPSHASRGSFDDSHYLLLWLHHNLFFLDSFAKFLIPYVSRKTESLKGRGPQSVRRDSRQSRPTPEFNPHVQKLYALKYYCSLYLADVEMIYIPIFTFMDKLMQGQSSNPKSSSQKHNPNEDGGSGFPIEPPRGPARNGFHHSSSMIHPSAYGSSRNKKVEDSVSRVGSSRAFGSSTNGTDMRTKRSQLPQPAPYSSTASQGKEETFK